MGEVSYEPGDKFIWEIPGVEFGPIFMQLRKTIGGRNPRAIFDCWGPDGRQFRRPRRVSLPLPPTVRREDWTATDLMRARLNTERPR